MNADPNKAIERLRSLEADYEAAHAEEDRLLWRVCQLLDNSDVQSAWGLAAALLDYRNENPGRTRHCA